MQWEFHYRVHINPPLNRIVYNSIFKTYFHIIISAIVLPILILSPTISSSINEDLCFCSLSPVNTQIHT